MANETLITVVGNLTGDPELRFTQAGKPVASFSVASTPRTFDRQTNEWKDSDPLFLRCSAWNALAENVAESLTKGMRVIVQGNLKQRKWTDREGVERVSTELDVVEVGPSLTFATAAVTRRVVTGNSGGYQQQQAPAAQAPRQATPAQAPQGHNDDPWAGPSNGTVDPPF